MVTDNFDFFFEAGSEILYLNNIIQENVHKITIPDGVTELRIDGDYLDNYVIPNGITSVYIESMGLKTLYIPDGVEHLYCSRNFLRTVEIPSSLRFLEIRNNLLTELTFRDNINSLEHIDIRSNRFKSLDFDISINLEYLNASFNDIEYTSQNIKLFLQQQYIPYPPRASTPDDKDSEFRFSNSI